MPDTHSPRLTAFIHITDSLLSDYEVDHINPPRRDPIVSYEEHMQFEGTLISMLSEIISTLLYAEEHRTIGSVINVNNNENEIE